jgi:hypothetical protein
MGQSKAPHWMHVLLPVLLVALRPRGDAPARSLTALAQRLGGAEAAAATGGAPWGMATFESGCLCQRQLEHSGDGGNRHWQPQALPLLG